MLFRLFFFFCGGGGGVLFFVGGRGGGGVLLGGGLPMAARHRQRSGGSDDLDAVGMIDGEHFVFYRGIDDLREKIGWFLKSDGERRSIARRGMEFVRKNHSNEIRVRQLTELLREII